MVTFEKLVRRKSEFKNNEFGEEKQWSDKKFARP
jgi:hypothetical protein